MSVAEAMRFDILKKPATAAMSQMSRSEKPAWRTVLRSDSSIPHGSAVNFMAKSSIARCRRSSRAARRQHEVVIHGDEGLKLRHVECIGFEHVWNEAKLFGAFVEIGPYGGREL